MLRALQLGDLLCAVPALRALRAGLPEAEIILIGLPWANTFVERFGHYLDGFLEFPGYPGLPERKPNPRDIPRFLAVAQRHGFDLAIQMHGSGTITNPLLMSLGAGTNAGCFLPGEHCPDPRRFLAYPSDQTEIRRMLRLMEFLGLPLQGEHLEFPLRPADFEELAHIEETGTLRPGAYACVHPGARARSRRWAAEHFTAVADGLAARGLRVVLTGSAEEAALTASVGRAMAVPALDLAGRTSMGGLAALLTGARLVVCNDTGVSHLADALRVPSVVIFTGSDPERWAPLDRRLHRVLGHPPESGREDARPEDVLVQADELLQPQARIDPESAAYPAALEA